MRTVDWHTGGEPFRIVVAGVPEIPGEDVVARRERARADERVDRVRQLLCREPRGHADMYGCFLVPPDDDGAHLGVLFWHNAGYSTACGHGTIALGAWAVATGRVDAPDDGTVDVVLDVPSGRVVARVRRSAGRTVDVTFRSVPSWVVARGLPVATSRGDVLVDVAWGGALYASLAADRVGLAVEPRHHDALVAVGREVKAALGATPVAQHRDDRLSGIYGTILHDDLGRTADGLHQRNVAVFADGQVDRSPCGSGTAARMALLADASTLPRGGVLRHESIVGSTFLGRVVDELVDDGRPAVVAEVTGTAHPTGVHRFVLDPDDALDTGFVLR